MNSTRLFLPGLLAACLLAGGCNTQDTLSGIVTLNGNPVAAATVIVVAADGKEHAATTDVYGAYQLSGLPRGKVQFRFQPGPKPAAKRPADPKTPAPTGPVAEPPTLPARYSRATPELTVEFTGGSQ